MRKKSHIFAENCTQSKYCLAEILVPVVKPDYLSYIMFYVFSENQFCGSIS